MSKQIAVAETGTISRHSREHVRSSLQGNGNPPLTYPTTVDDSLPNWFQVKMLKEPNGCAYDSSKGAVREGMHGGIYTPENDAKRIQNNGREIAVVARR